MRRENLIPSFLVYDIEIKNLYTWALYVFRAPKVPYCLFGIGTRQLEPLYWSARPDSPTYLEDCIIFLIWLNNVNNEVKK